MEDNEVQRVTKSDIIRGDDIEYLPIQKKSVNEIDLGADYDKTRKLLNI